MAKQTDILRDPPSGAHKGKQSLASVGERLAFIFDVRTASGSTEASPFLDRQILKASVRPAMPEEDMARRTRGKDEFKLPPVVPGEWKGEIYGGGSVNLGQVVQPGPPRQSVEFSYMVIPASLLMPSPKFRWPGIVMIMTPTPMKTEYTDAGSLFANAGPPSLSLSLNVTRGQFSDLLRLLEAQRFKEFHFTVEDAERANAWPVRSWGMATRLN